MDRDPQRDELTQRVGTNLRRAREAAGLRQSDLAARLREDQATVSKWERGIGMPRPSALMGLARALQINVADLFIPLEDEQPNDHDAPAVA